MMIVWRLAWKLIRTVRAVLYTTFVHCDIHTHMSSNKRIVTLLNLYALYK